MTGVLGVILAAGAGTRYDGPTHKLKARIGKLTVIGHACEALRAAELDHRAIVVGAESFAGLVPDGITVLQNPKWEQGQSTSLVAAVQYARELDCDALVVALGDQPGISPTAWTALGASSCSLATATYGSKSAHPIRLGKQVWDRLPSTGDLGARELLRGQAADVERIACAGNPEDVDVVEDLSQWIQ
ncbi:MAG: NTP transferase domain-containing protein [Acidimicrobiales bacterium]